MPLPMPPRDDPNPDNHASPAEFSTVGMLLKLVLLPGLVVLAISLTIIWLTRPAGDVESLIDNLAREGDARWLAALNLAAVLHEPGGAAIKRDPAIARRLIDVLQREIEAGRMAPRQIELRMYLCRALGEFHVADPLPVLLVAARTERNEKEAGVRRAALEAVAVLVSNVRRAGTAELHSDGQLLPCLLAAAADHRPQLRCTAAFTLGVVGGDQAQARLETMLADEHPEVRYNAATGLARGGNPKCIEVLVEMLDPDGPSVDEFKRTMIRLNALRAAGRLHAAEPNADLGKLLTAIERLISADVDAQVRIKATEVLHQLNRGRGE